MKNALTTLFGIVVVIAMPEYLKAQYGSNQLVNPGAESGVDVAWTMSGMAFDTGWQDPARSGTECWSASWDWGQIVQTVDLTSSYTDGFLATAPWIVAGVFVSTRGDHEGIYEVTIELLDAADGPVTDWTSGEITIPMGTSWTEVSYLFTSYGTEVRKVRMTLRGEDGSPDWGGNYGAAFDDAFVAVDESILSIELAAFTAHRTDKGVLLRWETMSEKDNAGFTLERKERISDPWVRLASHADHNGLVGRGSSPAGAEYSFTDAAARRSDRYYYRLSDVDNQGRRTFHPVVEVAPEIPLTSRLDPAYPNPFNPQTTIPYQLSASGLVEIAIFDVMGKRIATLQNGEQPAGRHSVTWDATDQRGLEVPTGNYLVRLRTGNMVQTGMVAVSR